MTGAEADDTGAPRLRRANRADIPALLADVGGPPAGRPRSLRRLLKTLVADIYVLEHGGGIAGVLAVNYRRSLAHGGLVATIDVLRVRPEPERDRGARFAAALVDCALQRARRRGCVAIDAASCVEPAAVTALEQSGLVEVAPQRLLSLRSPSPAPAEIDGVGSRGEA